MKRRDFLKCSLAVGAGLAASPSTYAFNGEVKGSCHKGREAAYHFYYE